MSNKLPVTKIIDLKKGNVPMVILWKARTRGKIELFSNLPMTLWENKVIEVKITSVTRLKKNPLIISKNKTLKKWPFIALLDLTKASL